MAYLYNSIVLNQNKKNLLYFLLEFCTGYVYIMYTYYIHNVYILCVLFLRLLVVPSTHTPLTRRWYIDLIWGSLPYAKLDKIVKLYYILF